MRRHTSQPARSRYRLATAILASAVPLTAAQPASAEPGPVDVKAVYRINFNGLDIGDFKFNSRIDGKSYTADGQATLSVLLGAYKWNGMTKSSGTVISEQPKPQGYDYQFKSTTKAGSVKLGFSPAGIASVAVKPEKPPHPDAVPVTEQHLKGVLDPLSAVIALTRGTTNPCARKLSIFDGKQRFDVKLSFRAQQPLVEKKPSGQPGVSYVCSVRYEPIAGHKPGKDDASKEIAASGNVEIALRPVPSANMMVPHLVKIPTNWGSATMTLQRIDITTPGNGQIALVQ